MISRTTILFVIALLPVVLIFGFVDPIPQWPEYHLFADGRTLLGIANAHNVLSNMGLLVVGAWGGTFALTQPGRIATGELRASYLAFFIGLILTAIGSAYYHCAPGSQTLIWDRLPMTIVFMGLITSIVGELVDARVANRLLVPLLIAGAGSVLWWAWTESQGVGDLRPYAIVQFVPFLLILFMLLTYPAPRHYVSFIVGMILLYGLAKICGAFDAGLYDAIRVSGHALKHLVSALASGCILMMLIRRSRAQVRGQNRGSNESD